MILVALGEHCIASLDATVAASEDLGSTTFGGLSCIVVSIRVPPRLREIALTILILSKISATASFLEI